MQNDRTVRFATKYIGFVPEAQHKEFIMELQETVMRDGCASAAEVLKGLSEEPETKELPHADE